MASAVFSIDAIHLSTHSVSHPRVWQDLNPEEMSEEKEKVLPFPSAVKTPPDNGSIVGANSNLIVKDHEFPTMMARRFPRLALATCRTQQPGDTFAYKIQNSYIIIIIHWSMSSGIDFHVPSYGIIY
jgi:hypothetical protein